MSNERQSSLDLLHPIVRAAANSALASCVKAGLNCHAFETLRSVDRQNKLYMVGRDTQGKVTGSIITKAKGGMSWHQYGLALDVVFKDSKGKWTWSDHDGKIIKDEYKKVAKFFKMAGFAWLGDSPKFPEMPHFEMTFDFNITHVKTVFDMGGIDAVYSLIKQGKNIS